MGILVHYVLVEAHPSYGTATLLDAMCLAEAYGCG